MWFNQIAKQPKIEAGKYYFIVDAPLFYEYKYKSRIPNGTTLYKMPPPAQHSHSKMLASINLQPNVIKYTKQGYKLTQDITSEVTFESGQASSPKDLIRENDNRQHKLDQEIHSFKEASMIHKYIITKTDYPHLYAIKESKTDNVMVDDFGKIDDIIETIRIRQQYIFTDSYRKKGRAYELTDITKLNKITTRLRNMIPIGSSEMDFIVQLLKLEPEKEKVISWKHLFFAVTPKAEEEQKSIDNFNSLEWVIATKQNNNF